MKKERISINELNEKVNSLMEESLVIIESRDLKELLIEIRENYNINKVVVVILENDLLEVSLVEERDYLDKLNGEW